MARVEGFEPPAPGLEGLCSIQLSYTRQVLMAPPNQAGRCKVLKFRFRNNLNRLKATFLQKTGPKRTIEYSSLKSNFR